MADNLLITEIHNLSSIIQELGSQLKGSNAKSAKSGITEVEDPNKKFIEAFMNNKSIQDLTSKVMGLDSLFGDLQENLTSGLTDSLQNMAGGLGSIFGGGTKTSEEDNQLIDLLFGQSMETPKPSDVAKLDANFGLGSLLLYWKLDEIHNTLKEKSGGDDKKGKGLGDIFTGLLKGAAGIALLAVALIVFAGALVVFSFVDWGPALAGLALFAGFIVGSIFIAKALEKEIPTFLKMVVAAGILSLALLVFTFALKVASSMDWGEIAKAMVVVVGFIGFVFLVGFLGTYFQTQMPNLLIIAVASAILSFGLIAFSTGLLIAANFPTEKWLTAVLVVAGFLVFTALVGVLGYFMATLIPGLVTLAIGGAAMSLALVVFAGALLVTVELAKRLGGEGTLIAIGMIVFFAAFLVAFAYLAPLAVVTLAAAILILPATLMATGAIMSFLNVINAAKSISFDDIQHTVDIVKGSDGRKGLSSILSAFLSLPKVGPIAFAQIMNLAKPMKEVSASLIVVAEAVKKLSEIDPDKLDPAKDAAIDLFDKIMIPMIDKLAEKAVELSGKSAKNLKNIASAVGPISAALGNVVDAVSKVAQFEGDLFKTTNPDGTVKTMTISSVIQATSDIFTRIMDPMLDTLADTANGFSNRGAKKIGQIADAAGPIAESINLLIDGVIKAANIDMNSLEKAKTLILEMFEGVYTGPTGVFVQMQKMKGLSNKVLDVIEVLPTISDVIDSVIELTNAGIDLTNSKSFDAIGGLATNLHKFNNATLSTIGTSLSNISTLNVQPTLQPLMDLASDTQITKFDALTASLNKVADAMAKIVSNGKEMNSIMEMDGGEKGKGTSSVARNFVSGNSSSTYGMDTGNIENYLKQMVELLQHLDAKTPGQKLEITQF